MLGPITCSATAFGNMLDLGNSHVQLRACTASILMNGLRL